MTDTAHAVKSAASYVKYAKTGADKLTEWSAAAQKLEKSGESLSEIQQALAAISFVSKLSAALGAVSVGLSVVQAFLPIKSTEDQILDAVTALSAQMTGMETRLTTQLTALENSVWTAASRTALESNHIVHIVKVMGYLNSIAEKRRKGDDPSSVETQLANYDLSTLGDAVTEIERYLTGRAPANLLKLAYDSSYGDPKKVLEIGGYYLHMAKMAVSAEAAAKGLLAKKSKGRNFTEADAAKIAHDVAGDPTISTDYAGQLLTIAKAADFWARKCLESSARNSIIKRYMEEAAMPLTAIVETDYQGSADRLAGALSRQYPWMNFSVMVYQNRSGFDEHGFMYSGPDKRTLAFFRQGTITGKTVNIIVYYSLRRGGKVKPFQHINSVGHSGGKRDKGLPMVSINLNMRKRAGLTNWNRRHVDDVRDFLKLYGSMVYPMHPKNLEGDMIWTAWCDIGETMGRVDYSKFLGFASQNPAVFKTFVHTEQRYPPGAHVTNQNRHDLLETHYEPLGYQVLVIHDDQH